MFTDHHSLPATSLVVWLVGWLVSCEGGGGESAFRFNYEGIYKPQNIETLNYQNGMMIHLK